MIPWSNSHSLKYAWISCKIRLFFILKLWTTSYFLLSLWSLQRVTYGNAETECAYSGASPLLYRWGSGQGKLRIRTKNPDNIPYRFVWLWDCIQRDGEMEQKQHCTLGWPKETIAGLWMRPHWIGMGKE